MGTAKSPFRSHDSTLPLALSCKENRKRGGEKGKQRKEEEVYARQRKQKREDGSKEEEKGGYDGRMERTAEVKRAGGKRKDGKD